MGFHFNLQDTIDKQQRLVIMLQLRASDGVEGATAELADAIDGLRNLYAMVAKPPKNGLSVHPTSTDYQIR